MPYGITQYYLPPGRGDIPAVTPAEGSVATCFRYGGVVNNQVKNGLLLSVRAKFIFLNR